MHLTRASHRRIAQLLVLCAWLLALPLLVAPVEHATASEPVLIVTPDPVSCATTLTVRGENFIPDSEVIVFNGGAEDAPTSYYEGFWETAVDGNGTFTIEGYRPSIAECIGLTAEPVLVTAATLVTPTGEQFRVGQPLVTTELTFQRDPSDPRVTLTPSHGSGCEEVTIHGENFLPAPTSS